MSEDAGLRKQLTELLTKGSAHITFEKAVEGFPAEKAGIRPSGSPHSAWELLEHIRIAQQDILAFSGGGAEPYRELKWPDDYWPASPAPASAEQWNVSAAAVRADLERFTALLQDPQQNLYEPFSWGEGQTLLREALLIADHNSYHLGQLMLVRRMLESGEK